MSNNRYLILFKNGEIKNVNKSTNTNRIDEDVISANIDLKRVHEFIVNKIAKELQFLGEDCYYPKVMDIFKELMNICQTDETKINAYTKGRYILQDWQKNAKNLNDPMTNLLFILSQ